jgi:hypothetical protein
MSYLDKLEGNEESLYKMLQEALPKRLQPSKEDPNLAKKNFIAILEAAKGYCKKHNVKISISSSGIFQAESKNAESAFIAESLNRLLLKDFKKEVKDFFNSEISVEVDTLAASLIGLTRNKNYTETISQHADKVIEDNDLDLRKEHSIRMLTMKHEVYWNPFFLSQDEEDIKATYENALILDKEEAFEVYDTSKLLQDDHVKALAHLEIAEKRGLSLIEANKLYNIQIVDLSNRKGSPRELGKRKQFMHALAHVKENNKPAFFAISDDKHWVTVGLIPNPLDSTKVTITYMNSQAMGNDKIAKLGKRFAEDAIKFITRNKALGFTLEHEEYQNLSVQQQIDNICGYATAMNISDQVNFFEERREQSRAFTREEFMAGPRTLVVREIATEGDLIDVPNEITIQVKNSFERLNEACNQLTLEITESVSPKQQAIASIEAYKPGLAFFGYDFTDERKGLINALIEAYKDIKHDNAQIYLENLKLSLTKKFFEQDAEIGVFLNFLKENGEELPNMHPSIFNLIKPGRDHFKDREQSIAAYYKVLEHQESLYVEVLKNIGKKHTYERDLASVIDNWLESAHMKIENEPDEIKKLKLEQEYIKAFIEAQNFLPIKNNKSLQKLPHKVTMDRKNGIHDKGEMVEAICVKLAQDAAKDSPNQFMSKRETYVEALPDEVKVIHKEYVDASIKQICSMQFLNIFKQNTLQEDISNAILGIFQEHKVYKMFEPYLEPLMQKNNGQTLEWKKEFTNELIRSQPFQDLIDEVLKSSGLGSWQSRSLKSKINNHELQQGANSKNGPKPEAFGR